jgi:metallo-beta-lactamase class B
MSPPCRPTSARRLPAVGRRLLPGLLLLALGCVSTEPRLVSVVSSPGRAEVRIDPLLPGVWRIIDTAEWISNSLAVETASGLVLVDTPRTPRATRAVLEKLEALTGRKPEILFLTHFHLDRVGGAAVLLERGVPVVAGQSTADLVARRFVRDREELLGGFARRAPSSTRPEAVAASEALTAEAAELAPFRPTRVVSGPSERFQVGGLDVEFIFPGRGHSPDNRVVYFPTLRLLFAGCLARDGDSLGNTDDADLLAWHDSVESLLLYDADVVVTGHGLRTSPNVLLDTMRLLKRQDPLPVH